MEYKLQDLVDIPKIQELLDSLYEAFRLPSAILDLKGNILTGSGWQDVCTKFHRVIPASEQECRKSDLYIMDHLPEADPAVMYCCPHGMVDCATPIIISGLHVANIFTGQFFLNPPDMEFFKKQAEKYGFDEQAYLEAVAKVPLFTREQLYKNLAVIRRFTEMLGEIGLKRLQGIKSEENMQKNRERLSLALDASNMGVFEWDIIQNRREWDEQQHRLMGLPAGTFSGRTEDFFQVIHPDDRQKAKAAIDRAVSNKARYETEFRVVWPDGSIHYINSRGKVHCGTNGSAVSIVGVSWDVTERRKSEEMLREALLKQDAAVKAGHIGLWDWDIASSKVVYSAEWKRQIGYEENEIGDNLDEWRRRVHPDDLERTLANIEKFTAEGRKYYETEFRFQHKNGEYRWILAIASVILDESARPVRVLGAHVDITGSKLAEAALAASESKYRLLFENMTTGFALHEMICDDAGRPLDFRYLDLNPAFEKMIGLAAPEIIGKTIRELLPGTESYWMELFGKVAETGKSESCRNYSRVLNRYFEVWAFSPRKKQIAAIFSDVTARIEAEEKLRESESRFKDIAENAADMIWELDASGKITYVSDAVKNLLGYMPDELAGKKSFYDYFTPDGREELKAAVFAVFAAKKALRNFISPLLRKDGHTVILETSGTPVLDAHGELLGFRGTCTDITGRKIADDQQRFSKNVLSLLNQNERRSDILERLLLLFKEFSGMEAIGIRIRDGNDYPYHTSTGFSREFIERDRYLCRHEVDGKICLDEAGAPQLACVCGVVLQARAGRELPCFSAGGSFWTNSISAMHKDVAEKIHCHGGMRNHCQQAGYESVALIPLRSGTEIIGLLQLNDKRMNMLTQEFINFMEDIGSSIGIALERIHAEEEICAARDEAESASLAKSEFLSTMSHEIRTPLNGILGFSSILAEGLRMNSSIADGGKYQEYLQIIGQCGESLRDIINDILEISSIESGHFTRNYEEFSPAEHIRQSLTPFIYKTKEKKISLTFKPGSLPDKVTGDSRRLTQIMFNLVGNAVKFTEHGGISVTADYAGEHLLIAVTDSGIGIPAEKLQKVLQPFYQADQSSVRKYGGTGLGLTIVHRLLERLGGTVSIQSKENHGTVVSITFPVSLSSVPVAEQVPAPAAAPAPVPAPAPAPAETATVLAGLNILVIEDEPFNIKYLHKILSDTGAEFKIVDTFAALRGECGHCRKPDVVMIDISLPDADGFECLQWLREKYAGQNVKYIVQTAHVMSPMTSRYKEAGFDDFIGKPYKKQAFIDIILKNIKKDQ